MSINCCNSCNRCATVPFPEVFQDQALQARFAPRQLNGSLVNLSLPLAVHICFLEEAVLHLAEQLVDAYSHIKKCNDEGRALMTRDIKARTSVCPNPCTNQNRTPRWWADIWARLIRCCKRRSTTCSAAISFRLPS